MIITQENLPEGWYISGSEEEDRLNHELQKELPPGHILYKKPVKVIAHRDGASDDILCQHQSDLRKFTVIHLSWSMKEEINSSFPTVEVNGTFENFVEYETKWN